MAPLSKSENEGYQNTVFLLPLLVVYGASLFYLWIKDDYPKSFGIGRFDNGRAGAVEAWWYSYKLLERHHFWDVILFGYMWLGPALIIIWFLRWQAKQAQIAKQDNSITTSDHRDVDG